MSDHADDPRRQQPVKIRWMEPGKTAHIMIDGHLWSEVEWSEKRNAWCIQDAKGRCLSHHSHIHAEDKDKAGALELAQAMIRDGRIPCPEDARRARDQRLERDRERRAKQSSELARQQLRADEERWAKTYYEAQWKADCAGDDEPFYELIADVFDLADPELWKRNSFARLRDRLVLSLQKEIANIEHKRLGDLRRYGKKLIAKSDRDPSSERNKQSARLARAKELLALLAPANAEARVS
jgi:hypothetical protein